MLIISGCPNPAGPSDTPVTGVSLDKATLAVTVGDTGQLTVSVTPSDADDTSVTWSTSAAATASVSQTGLVSGVAAGSAVITVTTADGGFTATCAVTVTEPAPIAVTGVSITEETVTLKTSVTLALEPQISPADATNTGVTWESDDTSVAAVDADGVVTALAVGTALITVTTDDGGKTDSCTVTVTDPDVYIAGRVNDGSNDVYGYWLNGSWNAAGAEILPYCIEVAGGTVYLGGADAGGSLEVPAYWADGTMHTLSMLGTVNGGWVADIEVVDGTVYCVGTTSNDAGRVAVGVWIDGVRHDMTDAVTEESGADSIIIHEGCIYVLGFIQSMVGDPNVYGYWLSADNGTSWDWVQYGEYDSSTDLDWRTYGNMYVDDTGIYAGGEKYVDTDSNGWSDTWEALYWKDGAETIIHDSSFTQSHSQDIAVSFGRVYVGANLNYASEPTGVGVYDVSAGTWYEVPRTGYPYTAMLIELMGFEVSASDVFLAARITDTDSNIHPGYWRNGTMIDLELPSGYAYAAPDGLCLGY